MAGPLPALRYCTDTPSAVAVRTAIADLAPAVCCCARGATGCARSARTHANAQTHNRLAMRSLLDCGRRCSNRRFRSLKVDKHRFRGNEPQGQHTVLRAPNSRRSRRQPPRRFPARSHLCPSGGLVERNLSQSWRPNSTRPPRGRYHRPIDSPSSIWLNRTRKADLKGNRDRHRFLSTAPCHESLVTTPNLIEEVLR